MTGNRTNDKILAEGCTRESIILLFTIIGFTTVTGSAIGCSYKSVSLDEPPASPHVDAPIEASPTPAPTPEEAIQPGTSDSEKPKPAWAVPAISVLGSILGLGALSLGGSKLAYNYNWLGFKEKVDIGRFYLKGNEPDSLASRWFKTESLKNFITNVSAATLKTYISGRKPPNSFRTLFEQDNNLKTLADAAIAYARNKNWKYSAATAWARFLGLHNPIADDIAEVVHSMHQDINWIINNVDPEGASENVRRAFLFYVYFKETKQLVLFE